MLEADLSGEVIDPLSPLAAAEVGVRRVPVPARVIVVAVRWYLRFIPERGGTGQPLLPGIL
jgi:hypothetical protein